MINSPSVLWKLRAAMRRPGKLKENFLGTLRSSLMWDSLYRSLPEPKISGEVPVGDPQMHIVVKDQLIKAGIVVKDLRIDMRNYKSFLLRAAYNKYPYYYNGGKENQIHEKSLEHFVAAELLDLNDKDVYIDIANGDSPSPDIYNRIFGCRTYAQDMYFKEAREGVIPGNACSMPVADGFASKMALHNSFEHFEDNDDVCFMQEANRVLQPGGRLCIIPLFLYTAFANQTDPSVVRDYSIFDSGATIFATRGWLNRFGRHYDVSHFIARIMKARRDFDLTVYYMLNEKEVDSSCYAKFVALFERTT